MRQPTRLRPPLDGQQQKKGKKTSCPSPSPFRCPGSRSPVPPQASAHSPLGDAFSPFRSPSPPIIRLNNRNDSPNQQGRPHSNIAPGAFRARRKTSPTPSRSRRRRRGKHSSYP